MYIEKIKTINCTSFYKYDDDPKHTQHIHFLFENEPKYKMTNKSGCT